MNLWATKSIATLRAEANEAGEHQLKRALTPLNLITLGIGAIIGAGIFVLTGQAAALYAGNGVWISMAIVGVACAFAGLCYAEIASAVPGAGSVGVGWSGHFVSLLSNFGITLPAQLAGSPTQWCTQANVDAAIAGCSRAGLVFTGAWINLPAVFIVILMSTVLVIGIKESATLNTFIVILKVTIIFLVVAVGLGHITPANYHPLIAPNVGGWGTYGWSGVLRGAGLVFFAYIGFDAVSTAAQEAKNPQKDMPIGILGSLAICTILYIVVSAVLTGMVPYTELNNAAPVAYAFEKVGAPHWVRLSIDVGAVLGLASVILVMLLGQSRVFYSMSRDGLLGKWAGAVHPRFRTPYLSTIFTGVAVTLATGLLPLQLLGQLVNIGTLLAFVLVCAGVWILRKKRPDLDRPFRTPWVPFVPIAGVVCCLGLMATLPADTWIRLIVWLLIGFTIYFGYSRKHSRLQRELAGGAGGPPPSKGGGGGGAPRGQPPRR